MRARKPFSDTTLLLICMIVMVVAIGATLRGWETERAELRKDREQVEAYLHQTQTDSLVVQRSANFGVQP